MKKLLLFATLFISLSVLAQKPQHNKPNFTPEQKAQLIVKKMAIGLDLKPNQITKIKPIIIAQINKTQALKNEHKTNKGQLSIDERFQLEMNKLDDEAKLHQQMEKILNSKQYDTWKMMRAKHNHQKKGGQHKKRKHAKQA